MNYREFRKRLLVSLMRYDQKNSGDFIELKQIADSYDLSDRRPGWLRNAATQLHQDGLIQQAFSKGDGTDDELGLSAKINGRGIEIAEEYEEELTKTDPVKIKFADEMLGSDSDPVPEVSNTEIDLTDEYFHHRTGLFFSLAHAVFVLGPGKHSITFGLQDELEIVRPKLIERAAIDLENMGLAEFVWPNQAINEETLEGVNGELTSLGWEMHGSDHGIFGLQPNGERKTQLPASDRLVSLDHNSKSYSQAVEAFDLAIAEFRKDHRLDNQFGTEKSALMKALEGGRELLSDTKINLNVGILLLIEPLKLLAQRYEKEIVGSLAVSAITAIMKLLGLD